LNEEAQTDASAEVRAFRSQVTSLANELDAKNIQIKQVGSNLLLISKTENCLKIILY
jgi:hypothetical protein